MLDFADQLTEFEELLDDCCLAFPLARNTPLDDPEHVKFTAARAAVVAKWEYDTGKANADGYVHGHDDNGKNYVERNELKNKLAALQQRLDNENEAYLATMSELKELEQRHARLRKAAEHATGIKTWNGVRGDNILIGHLRASRPGRQKN